MHCYDHININAHEASYIYDNEFIVPFVHLFISVENRMHHKCQRSLKSVNKAQENSALSEEDYPLLKF